jgi:hypothetical protein
MIEREIPAADVNVTYANISKLEQILNYHETILPQKEMQRIFA